MEPSIPYLACVLGAAGLFLLLRPGQRGLRLAGGLIALGMFVWVLISAASFIAQDPARPASPQNVFFYIFSIIAVASAGRMITHHRPVYCALYFVMVVLSSAALFLLLAAEFMAFALVIVYAGAILITYMFVLMLAQQAPQADNPDAQPEYDVSPREPLMATVVGFLLLATLAHTILHGTNELPEPPTPQAARAADWQALELMPRRLAEVVREQAPDASLASRELKVMDGEAFVLIERPGDAAPTPLELPESALPNNVQLVGVDLVAKFPVSLELAGVILLMAMFGAVVLARKQIELGEDEIRQAAGMRRLALHEEPEERRGRGSRS